jgi:WG containing repeat
LQAKKAQNTEGPPLISEKINSNMLNKIKRTMAFSKKITIIISFLALAVLTYGHNRNIIAPKYQEVSWFSQGMAGVKINDKWGFIDNKGILVIQPKYQQVDLFGTNGLSRVVLNDKWGVIDKTGKEIILPNYDLVYYFSNGLLMFSNKGKSGFLNITGKEIVQAKYDQVDPDFVNGLTWVKLNNKYGFIDTLGKEIVPLKYDYAFKLLS